MKYKVSVILPVFNVEKYLKQCLKSIKNQTMDENMYEVIAINDGSTDKSYEILNENIEEIKNLKIINQENSGLSRTRNKGITEADGEYLIFLDSDDMLKENTLDSLYQIANKEKLELVVYDLIKINEVTGEREKKTDRSKIYKKNILKKEEYFELSLNRKVQKSLFSSPLHFLEKQFLVKNKIKFKEDILHEDELFAIEVYKKIDTKIGYVNENLYIRRYRPNSIMSGNLYENKKSYESYIYILEQFSNIEKQICEQELINLIKNRSRIICWNLLRYKFIRGKCIFRLAYKLDIKKDFIRIMMNYLLYRK